MQLNKVHSVTLTNLDHGGTLVSVKAEPDTSAVLHVSCHDTFDSAVAALTQGEPRPDALAIATMILGAFEAGQQCTRKVYLIKAVKHASGCSAKAAIHAAGRAMEMHSQMHMTARACNETN